MALFDKDYFPRKLLNEQVLISLLLGFVSLIALYFFVYSPYSPGLIIGCTSVFFFGGNIVDIKSAFTGFRIKLFRCSLLVLFATLNASQFVMGIRIFSRWKSYIRMDLDFCLNSECVHLATFSSCPGSKLRRLWRTNLISFGRISQCLSSLSFLGSLRDGKYKSGTCCGFGELLLHGNIFASSI